MRPLNFKIWGVPILFSINFILLCALDLADSEFKSIYYGANLIISLAASVVTYLIVITLKK